MDRTIVAPESRDPTPGPATTTTPTVAPTIGRFSILRMLGAPVGKADYMRFLAAQVRQEG